MDGLNAEDKGRRAERRLLWAAVFCAIVGLVSCTLLYFDLVSP